MCVSPTPAFAQAATPHDVIVSFAPGSTPAQRATARADVGGQIASNLGVAHLQVVHTRLPVEHAAAVLADQPGVTHAEPDFLVEAARAPDDPFFGDQWGLLSTGQFLGTSGADVDASDAWDVTTGSPGVTVAVVDTGFASHPDLDANLWTNPGETGSGKESNGIDDDADGLIDDWRGWDFVDNDNDPTAEASHGTHVAGIVGAQGDNGIGIAGVTWRSKLMNLRVLAANGEGLGSDWLAAASYAAEHGARVVNLSLGAETTGAADAQVFAAYPRTLFVAAAGNGSEDHLGDNDDVDPIAPCVADAPNVICVAASDMNDAHASFSNYGQTSVDLAAPGKLIESTWTGGGYDLDSGTSMATPFVSGTAALLLSRHPRALASQVKAAILNSAEPVPDFAGKTVTGGRLNARAALDWLDAHYTDPAAPLSTAPPATAGDAADGGTVTATQGAWDNEPTDFDYQWRRCDAVGDNCQDLGGATSVAYAPTSADLRHTLRVAVTASSPDGQTTAVSNPTAAVVGSPELTAAPSINGLAKAGETITADSGSWDFSPTSVTYAWERCDSALTTCTARSGTQASYVLTDDDAGHRMRARVTATNAWGSTTSTTATPTVAARPPANAAAPAIVLLSGDAYAPGATLMATAGTWAPDPTTVSRRWERCDSNTCVDITTGTFYEITGDDRGHDLRAVVTATNEAGTTEAASARVAVAGIDAPPPPTGDSTPPSDNDTPPPVVLPPPSPVNPTTTTVLPPTPITIQQATAFATAPKLTKTAVSTKVTCTSATRCHGKVAFSYKRTKLGTATFDIPAGSRKTIAVKLSKSTAKKLPKKPKITATIRLATQP